MSTFEVVQVALNLLWIGLLLPVNIYNVIEIIELLKEERRSK